jgi:hypothetical protein
MTDGMGRSAHCARTGRGPNSWRGEMECAGPARCGGVVARGAPHLTIRRRRRLDSRARGWALDRRAGRGESAPDRTGEAAGSTPFVPLTGEDALKLRGRSADDKSPKGTHPSFRTARIAGRSFARYFVRWQVESTESAHVLTSPPPCALSGEGLRLPGSPAPPRKVSPRFARTWVRVTSGPMGRIIGPLISEP